MQQQTLKEQQILWSRDLQVSSRFFPALSSYQQDSSLEDIKKPLHAVNQDELDTYVARCALIKTSIMYILGCALVVAVWVATIFLGHESKLPWFIFPIAIFSVALEIQLFRERSKNENLSKLQKKKNWLFCHFLINITINASFFTIWYFTTFKYSQMKLPWFIFPAFVLAIILTFHTCKVFQPRRMFLAHIGMYFLVNAMLGLAWYFSGMNYPWFLWILGVYTIGIIVVGIVKFIKTRRRNIVSQINTNYKKESSNILPPPIVVDIPPPSYSIVNIHPQFSLFPTLPSSEQKRPFLSLPASAYKQNYQSLLVASSNQSKAHSMFF